MPATRDEVSERIIEVLCAGDVQFSVALDAVRIIAALLIAKTGGDLRSRAQRFSDALEFMLTNPDLVDALTREIVWQ